MGLIVIIGLAMLAFILGDFLNSGSSFFMRNRENIGEIAGYDWHYRDYEKTRDQLIEVYKIETGQTNFDDDFYSQIRNQVWQSKVLELALLAQAKLIGMDVTSDELSDLCIGSRPHQYITSRRAFFDEEGQFSRDNLVRFLSSLEEESDDPAQVENLNQARTYWLYWENAVKVTYLQDKYLNLVNALNQSNSLEVKYDNLLANTKVSLDYVVKPYYEIPDSVIDVPSSMVRSLYKIRRDQYKQIPYRSIEYVSFDIKPSEEDFEKVHSLLTSLVDSFVHTRDVALITNVHSDIPFDGRDYSESTIPQRYKDRAFARGTKEGDTISLVLDGNTYTMARVMKCHYKKADSVQLKLIADKEGQEDTELGWFQAVQLNKNIADPAFNGKKGERFTVKQGAGEQTFEIMDISLPTPKVQLAVLERTVVPSSKTYSAIYNDIKHLIAENNSIEKFEAVAKEKNIEVRKQPNVQRNMDRVGSLPNSRPIVRWAFEAKEGQVSDIFECGNAFIVATLVDVHDEEYRTLDDVRGELTREVMKNLKFEKIQKSIRDKSSMESIAQQWEKKSETVSSVNLRDGRLGGNGYEPAVLGTTLSMPLNEPSDVIEGERGAYVVSVTSRDTTGSTTAIDVKEAKKRLKSQKDYDFSYRVISTIQDKTEITDNRFNFL